jgi:prephenate dehydrogenase
MTSVQRLTLAGVGLINGSLALALKEAGAVGEVVGLGRDAARLEGARSAGIIDRAETDPAAALAGSEMVVVGVPMSAVRGVLGWMAPHLAAETIVTDVGSTKASVVEDADATLGVEFPRFVPAHPIAGTENNGFEAAFASLFRGRRVVLTPTAATATGATARVRGLWEACGSRVIEMSVAHHDRMLAATSHLPHLLAFGLVDTLARWDDSGEVFEYAAGGFRDFTRIASSDPLMWRDICFANRTALLETLEHYRADLENLTALIRDGDEAGLEAVFQRAKTIRDRYRPVFEQ